MSTSRAEHPRIIITSGEPAGIGPELCAQLTSVDLPPCELHCLVDQSLLEARAPAGTTLDRLTVVHRPLSAPSIAGTLDVRNAAYVVGLLDDALEGVKRGQYDAMVTAPVQKSVIAASGVPFSGHTEYLAERCGTPKPVMMLVAGGLRVALATTHLPLRRVPDAITQPLVLELLRIMHADLKNSFGIQNPRIAVCGLNPHAGEAGLLGDEELRHISPAIDAARREGIEAFGPLPADTAFVPREMAKADAFLAMFHDQGLPVLKHAGFGHAVNVTLGLPIIRTSVDHGTALTLAGTGRADVGSLRAAVELAIDLVHRRRATR
ncbi:MAG: 4-hydroxythreonine-4-phosphate dehydrogenase PdxA [Gammaproteobacteria bacterium]|jgi:4-hydroxythreonine-4-phosphate dehydrogenase|nr:4-hydroxythreonine-4-phosphate dehydrogenase PdxA [Gammaproteobacteria bacterium]